MKRVFSIIFLLAVFLSVSCASADILKEGWKEATDEELQEALVEINTELRTRQSKKVAEEALTISGHGTAIEQITVISAPSRITFTCTDKQSSDAVHITGGSKEIEMNPYRSGVAEVLINETGTFSALIETPDDWTLSVQPLVNIGAFTSFSGNYSVFTDIFTLDKPTIATVTIDPSDDIGSFFIELWYCTESGWDYDYEQGVIPDLKRGEPYSYDMILKPIDGATAYAIRVYSNYDGLYWSITAK